MLETRAVPALKRMGLCNPGAGKWSPDYGDAQRRIVEETKHFELKSPAFYLYPTYEHQRKELIKSWIASLC